MVTKPWLLWLAAAERGAFAAVLALLVAWGLGGDRDALAAPERRPGGLLHAAVRAGGTLSVPPEWIVEHPDLAGLFPSPAYSLEERWVFSRHSVCREAFYAQDVPQLASAHGTWKELRAALQGDDRYKEAKLERPRTRIVLERRRDCILHECRPPLSPPYVTLTVCTDEVPMKDEVALTRGLMAYMPALAGLGESLAIKGVRPSIATYRRKGNGRDEVEVNLLMDVAGQKRLRDWLLQQGFARPAAKRFATDWLLDSPLPGRSFILRAPTQKENLATISAFLDNKAGSGAAQDRLP